MGKFIIKMLRAFIPANSNTYPQDMYSTKQLLDKSTADTYMRSRI